MDNYECETCTATFFFDWECENHMRDLGHWPECETCNKTFATQRSCNQHMDDKDHWAPRFECEGCTRLFLSRNAASQHMDNAGHWAPKIPCEICVKKFYTRNAAVQHMNATGHWAPRIPCETCNLKFGTQALANEHMEEQAHYRNYCRDCDLKFKDENNLRMHLNSAVHRGTNLPCPFCKALYTAASGLIHHLERSACPRAPKLNRESILRMVRQRDHNGVITNKQLEWHETENVTYSATHRAFNGEAWECYMCHREFGTVGGLNAHLNSPVHKQKVYHCPNATSRCGKQFSTLAALFNHLESESCTFMRFEKVQTQVSNVFQGKNLLTWG